MAEMARKRVLITGGAGFIGSHLADELLARGYRVRALDSHIRQVHGDARSRPGYLAADVALSRGDVRDRRAVERALKRVDAVFHLAAGVGAGRSILDIAHCTSVNDFGTAVLLEAVVRKPVEKLVVASSTSVYGEGLYRTPEGRVVEAEERPLSQLQAGRWEPCGPEGEPLEPIPTPETKSPSVGSISALMKHHQERLCLMVGRAHSIPTVALRFSNVYGPRQALGNPDGGMLATFASRLLAGNAPIIFEVDRNPVACVALHDYAAENKGELACLCVQPSHDNKGIGRRLVQFVEDRAREHGLEVLLALSTQAFNFVRSKAGFADGTPDDLPPARRERYEQSGRRSRILLKALKPAPSVPKPA